jgi:parvulin-like peptidyl-prolyl isomerase
MRGERTIMRKWLLLCIVLPVGIVLAATGCGRKTVGEVNDSAISQTEYYKTLERMAVPLTQGENPVRDPATGRIIREQAGYLALRMLVDRRLILQMAEKEKVMPTEDEIKRELERQKKLTGFNERLKTLGYTQDDLKEDIKVELAAFKLITKGITVTDDEVKKAYQQNIQQFTIPAQVQVALILVDNRKTLDEVQKMLKKGIDFHLVAAQKSLKLPNMPQGGVWLRETDDTFKQFPQLWQTLQKTPVGSVTPPQPLKLPGAQGKVVNGWVLFKVLDKKDRQVRPLDEVKEDLRRLLMQAKSKRNLGRELMQMRAQAKVSFEIPRFNRRWQEEMKQLQQQLQEAQPSPALPTVPTPTPGGATP